ncbi:histidine kinase [Epilithonimonas sp.]|uniref:sensor histidine kinase n=1 Tax=Epilithonimonas sp. TaxID=2894511 RepID=UPI00289B00F2|nr:histidine kinase [Epilithonimonas sp.]
MLKYKSKELRDHFFIDLLIKDQYKILRHIVFLLFFFVLLYFTRFWHWYKEPYRYAIISVVYVSLVVMMYVNIYILVPFFFFKSHYIGYFALLILMGIVNLNLIGYCFEHFFSDYRVESLRYEDRKGGLYEGIIMCIPLIFMSTTVKLLQKWIKDNQKITELSNLTLNMELKELRNQINPHFLFNMMNNVKALIRTDPEKATIVIIKLSEFLRYQLYENNEEKTLLTSEIEFLSNFINLEKIRRENFNVDIKTETYKKLLNMTFIPPNLFTTFVENAVKHSVEINGGMSYVNINIEIKNQHLHFSCINSRNPNYSLSNEKCGGLGLANIKRRLELLYQDQFDLKTTLTDQEYIVNLIIPI